MHGVCSAQQRVGDLLLDPKGQSREEWTLDKKLVTLLASYRISMLSKDNISSNNHNEPKAIDMAISTENRKRLIETLCTFSWRFFCFILLLLGFVLLCFVF